MATRGRYRYGYDRTLATRVLANELRSTAILPEQIELLLIAFDHCWNVPPLGEEVVTYLLREAQSRTAGAIP
jgi:hypothetical protein